MNASVVVGAAIVSDGRLLAQQRAYPADVAGLWELPGGRVEPGESDVDALYRECLEEIGVEVRVGDQVGSEIPLSERSSLRVFRAELFDPGTQPVAREHLAVRWLPAADLSTVDWLPADKVLLPSLSALLGSSRAEKA